MSASTVRKVLGYIALSALLLGACLALPRETAPSQTTPPQATTTVAVATEPAPFPFAKTSDR